MSTSTTDGQPRRSVRSFVRRAGRLTNAQARALECLWPQFGLEPQGQLVLDQVFGRRAPRTLEIGFGMGDALLALAAAHPERDFIGIEVYEPGIGRALRGIAEQGLGNVRLISDDAVEVLQQNFADAVFDRVLVFFPDPWPKKRHHKRRLIQPAFTALLADKLAPGGKLHLATDWEEYADAMLEVIGAEPRLRNPHGDGCFAPRPSTRPLTKFENRGRRLGHVVRDLEFERLEIGPGQ